MTRSQFRFAVLVLAMIAIPLLANDACSQLLTTYANPGPSMFDEFGVSVAAVGSNVLVGAQFDSTAGMYAGTAYLFDGATGALLRTFVNPTPAANDFFAHTVAALGSNVLIGAREDDTSATNAGAVYLFNGSTGALMRTFLEPSAAAGDFFGHSIAAFGNNVLIGAPANDFGATDAGAVYLFDTSTGALLRTFHKPMPAANDQLGIAIAVMGSNILVGAPGTGGVGAVYLFDGATGALLKTFPDPAPPTPGLQDYFGVSVAAMGSNVLVGSIYADAGATDSGIAYLFDGSTGAVLQTFYNPTPATNDLFGYQVLPLGANVLISAPLDDEAGTDAGSVYVFNAANGALIQTLHKPGAASSDNFANSIAVLGQNVIVGVPDDDTGAMDSGRAYLFGVCGNGVVGGSEQCDHGVMNEVDNCCSFDCQVIDGDADGVCSGQDNCPALYNPDQRNSDVSAEPNPKMGDLCDACPADPANGCMASKSGCAEIGSGGGSVTTISGATLTFPAGALSNICNDAAHTPCTTTAQCTAVGATVCGPTTVCVTGQSAVKHCAGSSNAGTLCTADGQCPGGSCVVNFGVGNNGTNLIGGVAALDPDGAGFTQDVTLTMPWRDANDNHLVENVNTGLDTTIDERDMKVFRNGKQLGTCATAPQTLCSADLACPSGNCNTKKCSDVLAPCGTSALCCDIVANAWTLKVRTFSEYALGVECAAVTKPLLKLTHLDVPPGDDGLVFKGTFTLPEGASLAAASPLVHGVTLMFDGETASLSAVPFAAGAFDGVKGWKQNGTGTKWLYKDKSASPPGGIAKVVLQDQSKKAPGLVKFLFSGKQGTYVVTTAVTVRIVFPDSGDCGEATFPGPPPAPTCLPHSNGTALTCK